MKTLLCCVFAWTVAVAQERKKAEPWPKWPVFALVLAGDADGLGAHLAAHPEDRDVRNDNQELPIHVAADKGKRKCVEVLIAAGSPLASPAYNRFTPLHLAACRGHLEIVRLLVQQGVPLDPPSVAGTPLEMATKYGAREVALFLRNAGAAYDLPSAVAQGDLAWVEKLLGEQPDVQAGQQTLREAATRGHTAILRLLLPRAAAEPPNPFVENAPTGLCWCAIRHADTVALLLDGGEDLRQRFGPRLARQGGTLLHLAAAADAPATIDLLVDRGLEVDIVDTAGWSPLHVAAEQGAAEAVAALLRRGAKAHREGAQTALVLDLAVSGIDRGYGDHEIAARRRAVDLLFEAGAPWTLPAAVVLDRNDRVRELVAATPSGLDAPRGAALLGRAARMNHLDVVRTLLDAGVSVDAQDGRGFTAMHWAAFWDQVEAIDLLSSRSATIDVLDENGATPLHEAARIGRLAAARRLLQLGADRSLRRQDGRTPIDLARESPAADEFARLWAESR